MSGRALPDGRDAYPLFREITTRWMDNDAYGHVNNVVYYSWLDTAVNAWLLERGLLDIEKGPVIGLVVESGCTYFSSIAFPDCVQAGLRVTHVGSSSVRYEVGLFAGESPQASARAYFVHVYVDRKTRRPAPVPDELRRELATLGISG